MTDYVSFAVQAGDVAANEAVLPYYMKLRQLLASKFSRSYGKEKFEFAFVLRIDGSISHWNKYGCDYLRVSKKRCIATVDIFMPVPIWKDKNPDTIKTFLLAETRNGFRLMLERALKKGMDIDAEKFSTDFEEALEEFRTSI